MRQKLHNNPLCDITLQGFQADIEPHIHVTYPCLHHYPTEPGRTELPASKANSLPAWAPCQSSNRYMRPNTRKNTQHLTGKAAAHPT